MDGRMFIWDIQKAKVPTQSKNIKKIDEFKLPQKCKTKKEPNIPQRKSQISDSAFGMGETVTPEDQLKIVIELSKKVNKVLSFIKKLSNC